MEIHKSLWILRGRQAVHDLPSSCVPCRKLYGHCFNQPIAPLLSKRCSRSLAFEKSGIDFASPLFIKEMDRIESKEDAYICLITWATTRASHLALVRSLVTDDFLLAFRRSSLSCRIVYNDNMKPFKKADTVFSSSGRNWNQPKYDLSSQTPVSSGDLFVSALFGEAASMNQ